MAEYPLSQQTMTEGKKLLDEGKMKDLVFSEGTYQAEVLMAKDKTVWPFLQIGEDGHVKEAFCDCTEEPTMCEHIAASLLQIMGGHKEPLHVRFREHFFNKLCQMAAHRHGYESSCIKGKAELKAVSSTGKLLFTLKAKSEPLKRKIQELVFQRAEETEETSIKFFNLPLEELTLWREGSPSSHLQYELSFWSDFAKWWMFLLENEGLCHITFSQPKEGLPTWVDIELANLEIGFYIARASWPSVIPSLSSVPSPLKVEGDENGIKKIVYDKVKRAFILEKDEGASLYYEKGKDDIDLEGWVFVPSKGFFPKKREAFFTEGVVYEDKISACLERHRSLFAKYLVDDTIHEGAYPLRYHLYFDESKNLHINPYLFSPQDFLSKNAAYFGSFVYIEGKGFYEVEEHLFSSKETVIARDKVGDFVSKHKVWLNAIEGFQTHLMTIESEVSFHLSEKLSLCFTSHFSIVDKHSDAIDFGQWVYIPLKGFFQKEKEKGSTTFYSGLTIAKNDLPSFIRRHTEELTHLPGFFASHCPVDAVHVDILLTPDENICIRPHYTYGVKVDPSRVFFFGEYTYIDKEGFSLIPLKAPMDSFLEQKELPPHQQSAFIIGELDQLRPFIRLCDPRLRKTLFLHLSITDVQKDVKVKERPWLVDLEYISDVGKVDASEMWRALIDGRKHLFSSAGLIDLTMPRFSWLKTLTKGRWLKGGKQLRLSSLELARLSAFEDLLEPQGSDEKAQSSRDLLIEFRQMSSVEPLSIQGLKSELRLYQETGLKWLWFLYCNGLSGLLCDEMGLGKTHQAMALMAGAYNAKEGRQKFLVVCPTSVIYHWEDLLAKYLPHLRVSVFYGLGRELTSFEENYDLLLTSYGTLRSERKELSKLAFDVAVFDEVQNAKNIQSQTHKAILLMKYNMALGLTGTPLENRLLDLRALFEIILPGYLPQEGQFKEFFVYPIEKWGDAQKKELFAKVVRPFILRRKKSEVLLELPEKIEELYYCDLSDDQKNLYRETFAPQKDNLIKELSDTASSRGYIHIFSVLGKLKQICNHPVMINKDFENYTKYKSGKWDLFVERLQETLESGQKVVVFTQYLDMMDLIERYLEEKKIGYAEIRGSTRNRREQIEKFQKDPVCRVFVASLQAAGSGIELTSASVVIHYDRWWNPARENQATDRVHRLGQSRGVHVFKLVTKKSVEERINELIEKKSALFESVVGYDDQDHIKTLSRQELIELVKDLDRDLQ